MILVRMREEDRIRDPAGEVEIRRAVARHQRARVHAGIEHAAIAVELHVTVGADFVVAREIGEDKRHAACGLRIFRASLEHLRPDLGNGKSLRNENTTLSQ